MGIDNLAGDVHGQEKKCYLLSFSHLHTCLSIFSQSLWLMTGPGRPKKAKIVGDEGTSGSSPMTRAAAAKAAVAKEAAAKAAKEAQLAADKAAAAEVAAVAEEAALAEAAAAIKARATTAKKARAAADEHASAAATETYDLDVPPIETEPPGSPQTPPSNNL
jgi:hypothetical protein